MAQQTKKKVSADDGDGGGAPAWMVTFADLMTLLLTFFILLVAMSTLQDDQIKIALGSLRGALGVLDGGPTSAKGRKELMSIKTVNRSTEDTASNLNTQVAEALAKYHSDKFLQIGHANDSVTISVDETLLFSEGSDELQPGAYAFLSDVAKVIEDNDCMVEFVGHTDNTGGTDPRTNWEVGARRAVSVLTYVEGREPIDRDRLRVVSQGDAQPLSPNNSAANRSRNRRVEIVLITSSSSTRDSAESAGW